MYFKAQLKSSFLHGALEDLSPWIPPSPIAYAAHSFRKKIIEHYIHAFTFIGAEDTAITKHKTAAFKEMMPKSIISTC